MLNTNLHKFYFVMRPNRAGRTSAGRTYFWGSQGSQAIVLNAGSQWGGVFRWGLKMVVEMVGMEPC